MKIYVVITAFFPTPDSFRGSFIYDQVCAIARTKYYDKIIVLRSKPLWSKCHDYEYGGFKVHYFPIIQMPSNLLVNLPNALNKYLFVKTLQKIGIDIKAIAVAHAHVSLNACYPLALKSINPNIKTVLQHHDADPYSVNMSKWLAEHKWNTYWNSKYFVKCFNLIDLHVSVSKKVEHNLLSFPGHGKEELYPRYMRLLELVKNVNRPLVRNSYVLYNGVDTRIFYNKNQRNKIGKFRIGCIGNFTEIKNHLTLLRGVKRLVNSGIVNIEVVLVGSGPLLQQCKDYVYENELDYQVVFQTEMQHTDLLGFYNSLDLFVLPSYFEGFGCVFTEAYACGVPFITCYNQGISELVEEPEKWLIEKEDDEKLAKLIIDYMKYRPQQHLNQTYEIDKLIPIYLDFLEKLSV